MATFYGPVWLVIVAIFSIYLFTGRIIFEKRRQLQNFANQRSAASSDTAVENPFVAPGIVKTTEIYIMSEPARVPRKDHQHTLSTGSEIEDQAVHPFAAADDLTRPESTIPEDPPPEPDTSAARPHLVSKANISPQLDKPGFVQQHNMTMDANKAALKYCECALLFFVALLVTWVPSTVNRVYTLVHPDRVSFGMNYAACMVLPLQGFWNTVVYIATSRPACRALLRSFNDAFKPRERTTSPTSKRQSIFPSENRNIIIGPKSKNRHDVRSESTEELRELGFKEMLDV